MNITDCINLLKKEKENKVASRFPARTILVNSMDEYKNLIYSLSLICDETISSEVLFDDKNDKMPGYQSLAQKLDLNKWYLLPGVSEYLRLFYSSELDTKRFSCLWKTMVDASSCGRIIIPLWNSDTLWYDKALGLNEDIRQQEFVYTIDSQQVEEPIDIVILSGEFESSLSVIGSDKHSIVGLREWYEKISNDFIINNYCLITKLAHRVTPSSGNSSVHVVNDKLSFVKENLSDGYLLNKENCSDILVEELFPCVSNGKTINETILTVFNLLSFDGINIMTAWNSMSEGKKQLIKLWYKLNPDKSYLCHCVNDSDDNLEKSILTDIFESINLHPEWKNEMIRLSYAMNLSKDDTFFKNLNKLPTYESQLEFLTIRTKEERIYILRLVGEWLKKDSAQVKNSDILKKLYPILFAYITSIHESIHIDDYLDEYILDYKAYKLSNKLPEEEKEFFREIQTDLLPPRYSILNQEIGSNSIVLWVDAMGYEYLSLLLWSLNKHSVGSISNVQLCRSLLPTETEYNNQWTEMSAPYEKLDKLDKLAHKGVIDEPDYYSCIEEQLSFIDGIADHVIQLFDKYEIVIITGDHGTSRLAARFFHQKDGYAVIPNTKVYSHGRYCKSQSKLTTIYNSLTEVPNKEGGYYYVFNNYDHFKSSGFAAGGSDENAIYGEIHGGATPEEVIVPVVVINNKKEILIKAEWFDSDEVKIKRKRIISKIRFNKTVSNLQVEIGGINANCNRIENDIWSIEVPNIKAGSYIVTVIADGKIVHIEKPLNVKSEFDNGELI